MPAACEPERDRSVPGESGRPRTLAEPAFADDDGAADPRLRAALATGANLGRLAGSRLLVPIVAVADERRTDGSDSRSHMAAVSMVNATGEKGLLAFTGMDSLRAWDLTARPVPVLGAQAARAAVQDGAVALVIDVLGPHRVVVTGEDLLALADAADAGIDFHPDTPTANLSTTDGSALGG